MTDTESVREELELLCPELDQRKLTLLVNKVVAREAAVREEATRQTMQDQWLKTKNCLQTFAEVYHDQIEGKVVQHICDEMEEIFLVDFIDYEKKISELQGK